jgi:hypothetical protein
MTSNGETTRDITKAHNFEIYAKVSDMLPA